MITKELQDRFSLLLLRSTMHNKYSTVRLAEKHGLTVMQVMTLCLLDPGIAVPMKSLSSFVSCDPSNITGIIEKLVQERLVDRKEALHDRRIKTVMLTKSGTTLRAKVLSATLSARLPNLSSFTNAELEQLIYLTEKATQLDATVAPNTPSVISR